MTKGIKAKDLRDFEKCVRRLNEVNKRIMSYQPAARIYATPGTLTLVAGWEEDLCGLSQDELCVTSEDIDGLESGDW